MAAERLGATVASVEARRSSTGATKTSAGLWVMAVTTPVLLWIGLLVPALMVNLRFRGMPGHLAAADSLHWLFVLLSQALVMHAIGLVPPPGL